MDPSFGVVFASTIITLDIRMYVGDESQVKWHCV